MIRLTLPLPVSANRYWRVGNGRIHRSDEANVYRALVGYQCHEAGVTPLEGDVVVSLDVFRARKAGDLDNFCKCLLDSLKGYVYHDDSQVVELHAIRKDDKSDPRVEVFIERTGQ